MISTAVLSSGNVTFTELTDGEMARCGSSFCPAVDVAEPVADEALIAPLLALANVTLGEEAAVTNDNFKTDTTKIYIISGIFLAFSMGAALLIALFVDPLSRFGETDEKKDKVKLSGKQLLVATFKHMRKKEQMLIIPITIWSGIEQGFFNADFTAVSFHIVCCVIFHFSPRVLLLVPMELIS